MENMYMMTDLLVKAKAEVTLGNMQRKIAGERERERERVRERV